MEGCIDEALALMEGCADEALAMMEGCADKALMLSGNGEGSQKGAPTTLSH